jgi:ATP-dependent helicase/nuclease subunit A
MSNNCEWKISITGSRVSTITFRSWQNSRKRKIDRGARIESTIREGKWSSGKDKSAIGRIDAIAPQLETLVQEVIQLEETQGAKYYFAQQLRKNIYQLRVVEGISKAFEAVKEEENILAISEFQSLISKIVSVQDAPIIYERIGEKYDSILIDEFQDTSLLQFRNLLPLIENSQFKSEDSLIVGDAKQSIYRFKGGEAQQLVELPKVFGSDTSQILKEREVAINNYPTGTEVLNKNFRSRKNIIAFNNELYGLLSGKDELIQRIYTDHAQVCDEQKTGGFISIQEFNDKEEPEAKNVRVLEIIKECEAKDYSAGDIAILVRDNKRGSELANILMLEGYSIDTGESLLFTQSQAVNILIAVLQYLSDPFNVLFRHELLHEIGVTETMDFEALKALLHSAQSNFDVAISKHTQSTFDTAVLKQQSVFAVCEASAFLFALPVNDVFVTSFFDLVQDYLQKNGDSLADFLQWWDEVKTKKSIQSNAATSAIKIMTIHKSKGLQFPIVIMPDTDWQIRNSVSNVWLEEVEDIPISPILLPLESGLQKTEFGYLYDAEKQKAKLDNINLLYVATTRPVDRLYMLFSRHEQKDEETYVDHLLQPFLQAKSFADLY